MQKTNLLVISGTTRPGNFTSKCANLIKQVAQNTNNYNVKYIDITKLNINDDGNQKDKTYSKLTEWADAFFIVTPEYNHSFPGGLKRVLDSEGKNYLYKPANIAGVSSGQFGGSRAVQSLVLVLRELGLIATFSDVFFPNVKDFFDNKELVQKQEDRIKKSLKEIEFMSKSLKWGRDNLQ